MPKVQEEAPVGPKTETIERPLAAEFPVDDFQAIADALGAPMTQVEYELVSNENTHTLRGWLKV